ncbi:unnamed protein product [Blepharisma stoltei]|uniref:Ras-related protein Rab-4B n=1 Tax=Blepharisma stoltei TaxID=1481888 RepID=A0AAU9K7Z2_9CILI|nr:unnamed protein product [Blepharisma stoltei]
MDGERDYDYMFKVIIIGESGTGKSCLLHYLIENRFKRNPNHTVGVEFGCKRLSIGDKQIKLQIWDTAGQERFRSVTKSYYRGAAAALVVYDITNSESFQKLPSWINDVRTLSRPNISLIVVGNKCDLKSSRAVSVVDASCFCQEQEVPLIETSAATGENVEEAFMKLAKSVLTKLDNKQLDHVQGIQPGPGRLSAVHDRSCSC